MAMDFLDPLDPDQLRRFLRWCCCLRLPLHDEKLTQSEFAHALDAAGFGFEREVPLSKRDCVDFMLGGLAVELKIKGRASAIRRQLDRYATHDRVKAVCLLTARAVLLPDQINGKPAYLVSLSQGWL
ncbi:MAG: hypothetical protein E6Q76_14335 [Rhizobium sp.]|nr:MAG: hypothetical protein E6Q76_14335 [Rhizobium sp.]